MLKKANMGYFKVAKNVLTWCGLGKQNRPTYNALSGLQTT